MSDNQSIPLSSSSLPRSQSFSVLLALVVDILTNHCLTDPHPLPFSNHPVSVCVGSFHRSARVTGLTMGERIQNVRRKCQLKITREHVKVGFEGTDIFAFDMDEFIRPGSR